MGRTRHYDTIDSRLQISLSWLRKRGCLKGGSSGVITWTSTFRKEQIGYDIYLYGDSPYMRLHYISRNYWDNGTTYDYRVRLLKTRCQFGGYRWWFICPYCYRKAMILMDPGKGQYGCRICLQLSYFTRQRSYHGHIGPLKRMIDLQEKYHRLRESVKKLYYRGKLTKKTKKLLAYKTWFDSVTPQLQSQIDKI